MVLIICRKTLKKKKDVKYVQTIFNMSPSGINFGEKKETKSNYNQREFFWIYLLKGVWFVEPIVKQEKAFEDFC